MEFLLESPWTIGIVGVLLAICFFAGWTQTGRTSLLGVGVVLLLVTGAAVFLERMIVTDREQIRSVLDNVADDLEAGRFESAVSVIHPSFTAERKRAENEFPKLEFESVDIKDNLKVKVVRPPRGPTTATASFNVTAVVSSPIFGLSHQNIARFVELTLQQEDGKWYVTGYSHQDFRAGLRSSD